MRSLFTVRFRRVCLLCVALLGVTVSLASRGTSQSGGAAWILRTPMQSVRFRPAVAAGRDGRIYAIGGCCAVNGPGAIVSDVEAYDPTTNTWTYPGAKLPTRRNSFGAAIGPDGRIYTMGERLIRSTISTWS
jgi:hypothetical protein